MFKVCLINPPSILPARWGVPMVFQPLGLAYIAASLEREYDVTVLDAHGEGWRNVQLSSGKYYSGLSLDSIKERISKIRPNVVGISAQFSVNVSSALKMASLVKSIDKEIIVILGGPHPTICPVQTLSHPAVDYVVIGEGECTTLELIQTLQRGFDCSKVKGIGYKKKGKLVLTPPRELIANLDALPPPARHLLPMDEYFAATKAGRGPRRTYTFGDRWATIITSRGCPFNCNFCSIHITMGRRLRARKPELIVSEIEQLVKAYGVTHINFEDDNITMDRNRFKRICDLIIERGLAITWSAPNGIRADTLDEEMVSKMKLSGCRRVFVAPESGVQRVVTHVIGKNLDLKRVEESVLLFHKHGITVDASFVIGLIGETKEDIWNTIDFAVKLRKLGLYEAGFNIATPLYGTKLYDEAKSKGYLKAGASTNSLLSTSESLLETPEFKSDEVFILKLFADWIVNFGFKRKCLEFLFLLVNTHKLKILSNNKKFFMSCIVRSMRLQN